METPSAAPRAYCARDGLTRPGRGLVSGRVYDVVDPFRSRLGDGWLWLAVALIVPLLADSRPIFSTLLLAAAVSNIAQYILKRGVRRRRPIEYAARFAFDAFSFPSGHALNAFAFGAVLSLAFPPLSPLVLLLAGSIALSRVTQGFHFVGDVLAGATIGTAIGVASFWAVVG
jgi:undecaprenyl-diphosphatase